MQTQDMCYISMRLQCGIIKSCGGTIMKKYFNRQGLAGYPEDMKKLRFCCWKMEKVGDRMTKVPPMTREPGRKPGWIR